MSSPNPPRRFDITPIETTRHSNRSGETSSKPRKFAPQPIEHTTASPEASRKHAHSPEADTSSKAPPRRFAPQVIEHTTQSNKSSVSDNEDSKKSQPRRFAPQAVEHTSSFRNSGGAGTGEGKKPVRRFAPQMVESTQASSRETKNPGHAELRFSPVVIETTYDTTRTSTSSDQEQTPRKFKPILIDTASRSRRAVNAAASWKTEEGFDLHAREHRQHITGTKTPHVASSEDLHGMGRSTARHEKRGNTGLDLSRLNLSAQPRRRVAPLDGSAPPRRTSMCSQRSHSFRPPDLDTIESSESSEPQTSSSSQASSPGQNSPLTISDSSFNLFNDATRRRESIEPGIAQYLLDVQAKKQQQRMEQEALYAAFPTETVHEKVHHYINDDEDSDTMSIEERPVTFDPEEDMYIATRRHSTAQVSWEQLEMQRHAEALQQERNANRITAKKQSESPWWAPPGPPSQTASPPGARPPMLGDDITFPRCPSPEPARFDVTQGSKVARHQLADHSQQATDQGDATPGLWQAKTKASRPAIAVQTPEHSNKSSPTKGLWGGFCVAKSDDGKLSRTGPTGLMTPYPEPAGNPFEQAFAAPNSAPPEAVHMKTPLTGGGALANADLAHLDGVLNAQAILDRRMEEEFPDSFVTQVYNYLSLGYPSLARPFDDELSKISKASVAELRADDQLARQSPRGYIRLGSDFEGGGGDGLTEQNCARWKALKSYIREWARQEDQGMIGASELPGVGVGVRRGSWAH